MRNRGEANGELGWVVIVHTGAHAPGAADVVCGSEPVLPIYLQCGLIKFPESTRGKHHHVTLQGMQVGYSKWKCHGLERMVCLACASR